MLTEDYKTVLLQLLAGNRKFTPNYLYLEYKNTFGTVAPPTNSTEGKSYYESFENSDVDGYLRIPITIKPTVQGDTVQFTVLVTNTDSQIGAEYSMINHSTIYGVALVIAPEPEDHTQDIVFSREYLEGNKQLIAIDDQTFCFNYQLSLTEPIAELDWLND